MKQFIALMIILLMNIAPATAYQKVVTKEDMKYGTVQPLEASIAIGSPEIANAYKEGEQVKVEDDDIDLIEKHKKIKDELEKDAIIITVGDTKEFLIKRDGQESQVQVTLTSILDRNQDILPTLASDESKLQEITDAKKKTQEANYCANFIVHGIGSKQPQPIFVEPEALVPPMESSKEQISPPSAEPQEAATVATVQQPEPAKVKSAEQDYKETAEKMPGYKIAPVLVQPPTYYGDQELCLSKEDTGFIIWVYDIDRKKQEVTFALYADGAYSQEIAYPLAKDAEISEQKIAKVSPSQIRSSEVVETAKKKEKPTSKGCKVNGKNVEIGARFIEEQEGREVAMYCDPSGRTLEQKEAGDEAQEEYECISGKVEDDRCKGTLTILQRILSLFGLF